MSSDALFADGSSRTSSDATKIGKDAPTTTAGLDQVRARRVLTVDLTNRCNMM